MSMRIALREIEQAHSADKDSGDALVADLCQYRRQLPNKAQEEWDAELLRWVRDEAARYWSVALDALHREGGRAVNEELAAMLRNSERDGEWREGVVLALIRRGYRSLDLNAEVERAARVMSPMGLSNLAKILSREPELVSVAVDCIVGALAAGDRNYLESRVPALVLSVVDSDPKVLVHLVRRVRLRERGAGEDFLWMVVRCLEEPHMDSHFADGLSMDLVTELRRMART